jgi:hypothetical protein
MNGPGAWIQSIRLIRYKWLVILTVCVLPAACSSSKNVELAKQAVEQFHSQFDSEQYSAVYAAADDKFHSATSEADFVKLLQAVHRKLGAVQRSNLRNTGVAWFAGQGATVTLVYNTTFSTGSGTEQFVWHVSDNRTLLYGYHMTLHILVPEPNFPDRRLSVADRVVETTAFLIAFRRVGTSKIPQEI